MPELPEVETIRAGLQRWVSGRTIDSVEVLHPRAVRRHPAGAADFAARLIGQRIETVSRRGKYLWLPLAGTRRCILAHLGMSGQLLLRAPAAADEKHLRVRVRFADPGPQLRFVDQRTFGGLLLDSLVPAADVVRTPGVRTANAAAELAAGECERIASLIVHIARDPLDPRFDDACFAAQLRRRASALKRALLDQGLVSGIGNIYADEALWRARLCGERRASALRPSTVAALLGHVRAVLRDALAAGGTSFDTLYVNVNGEGGYFERSLAVYGRAGLPCLRCGTAIRRTPFMNRSSFSCPRCQRRPGTRAVSAARS